MNLEIGGRKLTIPDGTVTDFSSYPRWLPGPAFHRIDLAGVCHDHMFATGMWGDEPVTFFEANRVWFDVARAGSIKSARANWLWAWVGRIGLGLFSYPVWWHYRLRDRAAD
jgi:hypothetical protein